MKNYKQDEVERYYDSHPTAEDLMGEASLHASLVHYLMEVLRWQMRKQYCAVYENLNLYATANAKEYPLAPDVLVFKGVEYVDLRSWSIGKTGPAPQVVFEVASDETWQNDVDLKPARYGRMGVQEYFLYDPHTPSIMRSVKRRLLGWRMNPLTHTLEDIPADLKGRLWSQHLESSLLSDGAYLRLYDSEGQRRLTEAEARARNEHMLEQEAQQSEQQRRLAEQRAQQSEQQTRILKEKLRSLGIDPDKL